MVEGGGRRERLRVIRPHDSRAPRDLDVQTGDTLTLSPDPAAVRLARDFVEQRCHALGLDDDVCHSAVLMVSETVTNAFLHGRSEARIRVSARDGRLRVEVADDNSRHPRPVEQDHDALDGRGITIVAMLSHQWGVRTEDYGKTVWFEV
jgi:anti-sigma regulatory factor (Ser/Thr protein kinase)